MYKNGEIRKLASRLMLERGRYLPMLAGMCICTIALLFPLLLFLNIDALSYYGYILRDSYDILFYINLALSLAVAVFVTLPIIGGFFCFAYGLFRGEKRVHPIEMFRPFRSAKLYLRTIISELFILFRLVVAVAIPILCVWICKLCYPIITEALPNAVFGFAVFLAFALLVYSVGIALLLLFAYLTQGAYFVPYLICRGLRLGRAFLISRRSLKGKKLALWRYFFGFTPIFLLSLLSFGIVFVVYSLPMMIFAYFLYAEQILDKKDINI